MQNANRSQEQKPLCLYWLGTGNVLWAIESTHLGSICLYYVTSISSLSFSPPLFENPHHCFSHSVPPPVICVSLVIIIAYWKRCGWLRALPLGQEKQQEKNKETSIFFFLLWETERWTVCGVTLGCKQHYCCSSHLWFLCFNFLPKNGLQGGDACCFRDFIPFLLSHSIRHSYNLSHTCTK